MEIKVGNKYRFDFGKDNRNTRVVHVLAIIDGDQIVIKRWLRGKQWWLYTVEPMCWFDLLEEKGQLKKL